MGINQSWVSSLCRVTRHYPYRFADVDLIILPLLQNWLDSWTEPILKSGRVGPLSYSLLIVTQHVNCGHTLSNVNYVSNFYMNIRIEETDYKPCLSFFEYSYGDNWVKNLGPLYHHACCRMLLSKVNVSDRNRLWTYRNIWTNTLQLLYYTLKCYHFRNDNCSWFCQNNH